LADEVELVVVKEERVLELAFGVEEHDPIGVQDIEPPDLKRD